MNIISCMFTNFDIARFIFCAFTSYNFVASDATTVTKNKALTNEAITRSTTNKSGKELDHHSNTALSTTNQVLDS